MTAPEDDLEKALRRALSAAVGKVEPGVDGLERIRARPSHRPPQPWLLAVVSTLAARARNWTWRGHWAWPSLSSLRRGLVSVSRLRVPVPRERSVRAVTRRAAVPELSAALRTALRGAGGRGW